MNTYTIKKQTEELFSLHLKVLKYILNNKSFIWIQEKLKKDFKRLNYLIIMDKSESLSFDQNGKLIGAYPISPIRTQYRIHVEDVGSGYAMCAIDALGVAFTFGSITTIKTFERSSNSPIKIIIDPSLGEPPQYDLYVTYKRISDDTESCAKIQCPIIHFYSSKEAISLDQELNGIEILSFKEAYSHAKKRFIPSGMKAIIFSSLTG